MTLPQDVIDQELKEMKEDGVPAVIINYEGTTYLLMDDGLYEFCPGPDVNSDGIPS